MRTEITEKIPADRLEFVKQQYRNAGATEVVDKPDGEGTYTVTASFEDD